MNVLTDHSRDARIAVNLDGFCTKLRAPECLHALVMSTKPDHVSLGDHLLTALLDSAIDTYKIRRDYRGLHSLLGTLFGDAGAESAGMVPDGTTGAGGHRNGGRR